MWTSSKWPRNVGRSDEIEPGDITAQQTVAVSMPCPGSLTVKCSSVLRCWYCDTCYQQLFYATESQKIGCRCGLAPAKSFLFRCKDFAKHERQYVTCPDIDELFHPLTAYCVSSCRTQTEVWGGVAFFNYMCVAASEYIRIYSNELRSGVICHIKELKLTNHVPNDKLARGYITSSEDLDLVFVLDREHRFIYASDVVDGDWWTCYVLNGDQVDSISATRRGTLLVCVDGVLLELTNYHDRWLHDVVRLFKVDSFYVREVFELENKSDLLVSDGNRICIVDKSGRATGVSWELSSLDVPEDDVQNTQDDVESVESSMSKLRLRNKSRDHHKRSSSLRGRPLSNLFASDDEATILFSAAPKKKDSVVVEKSDQSVDAPRDRPTRERDDDSKPVSSPTSPAPVHPLIESDDEIPARRPIPQPKQVRFVSFPRYKETGKPRSLRRPHKRSSSLSPRAVRTAVARQSNRSDRTVTTSSERNPFPIVCDHPKRFISPDTTSKPGRYELIPLTPIEDWVRTRYPSLSLPDDVRVGCDSSKTGTAVKRLDFSKPAETNTAGKPADETAVKTPAGPVLPELYEQRALPPVVPEKMISHGHVAVGPKFIYVLDRVKRQVHALRRCAHWPLMFAGSIEVMGSDPTWIWFDEAEERLYVVIKYGLISSDILIFQQ